MTFSGQIRYRNRRQNRMVEGDRLPGDGQAIASTRAGTDLCHGVPAHGSRSSLAVSSLGATPVTMPTPVLDVIEPEPVRQRHVARAASCRRPRSSPRRSPASSSAARGRRRRGRDASASAGLTRSAPSPSLLAPRRVADDRVGGERAPLAGREHERPLGVVTGRRLVAIAASSSSSSGITSWTRPSAVRTRRHTVVRLVLGEHDARRAGEDGVEEPVGGVRSRRRSRPGARRRGCSSRIAGRRPTAPPPPRRRRAGSGRACGRARPAPARRAPGRPAVAARKAAANACTALAAPPRAAAPAARR